MKNFLALEIIVIYACKPALESDCTLGDINSYVRGCKPKYMDKDLYVDLTHLEWVEDDYESFDTELELVEDWAANNGLISSEEEASEAWRSLMIEQDELAWLKMSSNEKDTLFADWVDSQTKDNSLHSEQYKVYEYCED